MQARPEIAGAGPLWAGTRALADSSRRPKRKRYRYRWPDEIHDDVLARLLALNEERAALEGEAEKAAKPKYGVRRKARTAAKASADLPLLRGES